MITLKRNKLIHKGIKHTKRGKKHKLICYKLEIIKNRLIKICAAE